jgi:hypothetical protein
MSKFHLNVIQKFMGLKLKKLKVTNTCLIKKKKLILSGSRHEHCLPKFVSVLRALLNLTLQVKI